MHYQNIIVFGGSGFIGQALVSRLASQHRNVVVPTRRRRNARELFLLPTVNIVQCDIHADQTLDQLVRDADAVVNLVGVLHSDEGGQFGPDFEQAHLTLPARIAQSCTRHGKRLVHVSALGADPTTDKLPSRYLRSKSAGEKAVMMGRGWTILRPSVVFGPGDNFLNLFSTLQKWSAIFPLAKGKAQLQPVYVGDLVTAIQNALASPVTLGKTYEIAGPEIYTLRELVEMAGQMSSHSRKIFGLSDKIGYLMAGLLEKMPGPTLMSRDNLDSLDKPNIANGPIAPELGVTPCSIAVIAPKYLRTTNMPHSAERARARR